VIIVDANRSTMASHIYNQSARVRSVSATETATVATTWRDSAWTVRTTVRDFTASTVLLGGMALRWRRTARVRFPLLLLSPFVQNVRTLKHVKQRRKNN